MEISCGIKMMFGCQGSYCGPSGRWLHIKRKGHSSTPLCYTIPEWSNTQTPLWRLPDMTCGQAFHLQGWDLRGWGEDLIPALWTLNFTCRSISLLPAESHGNAILHWKQFREMVLFQFCTGWIILSSPSAAVAIYKMAKGGVPNLHWADLTKKVRFSYFKLKDQRICMKGTVTQISFQSPEEHPQHKTELDWMQVSSF